MHRNSILSDVLAEIFVQIRYIFLQFTQENETRCK